MPLEPTYQATWDDRATELHRAIGEDFGEGYDLREAEDLAIADCGEGLAMPSPFPGMDPYLEGSLWQSVHLQLSMEIARQLAPKLRPRCLALTPERFVYESPDDVAITTRSVCPDIGVRESGRPGTVAGGGGVAVAPLRIATQMPVAVPHVSVEIRDTANRQLVTGIEVLSPSNKRGEGRLEYLAKRRHLLLSTAHLMEIDLLREGERVPMQRPLPSAPYFVFLSRLEDRPIMEVWPITLEQPLPTVPVPLLAEDADVLLDLQQAFTNVYESIGYDLAVDYTKPPEIALPVELASWVADRLRP